MQFCVSETRTVALPCVTHSWFCVCHVISLVCHMIVTYVLRAGTIATLCNYYHNTLCFSPSCKFMCYFRPGYNSSVIDTSPRQVRENLGHGTGRAMARGPGRAVASGSSGRSGPVQAAGATGRSGPGRYPCRARAAARTGPCRPLRALL